MNSYFLFYLSHGQSLLCFTHIFNYQLDCDNLTSYHNVFEIGLYTMYSTVLFTLSFVSGKAVCLLSGLTN